MTEPSWVSLLPPVLAIGLAIWTRQVFLSLLAGIYLGWTILSGWDPFNGFALTLEAIVNVFKDSGNTRVILFCSLVGGLITLLQRSGGVEGFIQSVTRRGWLKNRRTVQLTSAFLGMMIFVETTISCLIVGTVYRPLFDRWKISREKLAYICDSTCAPVNLLIPLNAWGAFIIGLLARENIENPVALMVSALPFNFYAIFTIILVIAILLIRKDFGPMRRAEQRVLTGGGLTGENARPVVEEEILQIKPKPGLPAKASNMLIPVGIMILMMPVGLLITGKGDITAGSGTTAVFWAVVSAIAAAVGLYSAKRLLPVREIVQLIMKGIGGMVPLVVLMIFAFAIGDVTRELKTGIYVAQAATQFIQPFLIPMVLFILSAFISFSTGTSWGTFALIMPIAVPLSAATGVHLPLVVSAALGGGLFGDHCSPISDTTLVASMASACDHIDHVRTQLPYALAAAAAACAFYVIFALAG